MKRFFLPFINEYLAHPLLIIAFQFVSGQMVIRQMLLARDSASSWDVLFRGIFELSLFCLAVKAIALIVFSKTGRLSPFVENITPSLLWVFSLVGLLIAIWLTLGGSQVLPSTLAVISPLIVLAFFALDVFVIKFGRFIAST
jgi:hypothetical protein